MGASAAAAAGPAGGGGWTVRATVRRGEGRSSSGRRSGGSGGRGAARAPLGRGAPLCAEGRRHRKTKRVAACATEGHGREGLPLGCVLRGESARYDALVLGSGIAGLSYAIEMADMGHSVAVVTKASVSECNTAYAQGGVAAVLNALDSYENHIEDTMVAGAHLSDPDIVDIVVREGPEHVLQLGRMGADFDRDETGEHGEHGLHLTREGGHSHYRIVHKADLTGAEIERVLVETAMAHANIDVLEHHAALELVTDTHRLDAENAAPWVLGTPAPACFGAYVLDRQTSVVRTFLSTVTLVCTGGGCQVYQHTTNPAVATGDGISMAYRAGARIGNMEFVQFHPTALYQADLAEGEQSFLITEAVRGEGGRLLNRSGERFMVRYDPERLELAPRDVVARAIDAEMKRTGEPCVFLDISHRDADFIRSHFPNITRRVAEVHGIDITRDAIPVVPAAHYMCGGVSTDAGGATNVPGLFSVGEASYTGLHGSNRLASNSLLEGLVFANRAAKASAEYLAARGEDGPPREASAFLSWIDGPLDDAGCAPPPEELVSEVAALTSEVKAVMWKYAGIVRERAGLAKCGELLEAIHMQCEELYIQYPSYLPLVELRNLLCISHLIQRCAAARKESRGLHYNVDYADLVEAERHPSFIDDMFGDPSAKGLAGGASIIPFTRWPPASQTELIRLVQERAALRSEEEALTGIDTGICTYLDPVYLGQPVPLAPDSLRLSNRLSKGKHVDTGIFMDV